jgi:hypothetical protein
VTGVQTREVGSGAALPAAPLNFCPHFWQKVAQSGLSGSPQKLHFLASSLPPGPMGWGQTYKAFGPGPAFMLPERYPSRSTAT